MKNNTLPKGRIVSLHVANSRENRRYSAQILRESNEYVEFRDMNGGQIRKVAKASLV